MQNEAIKQIRKQICNEKGVQRYCRDNCIHGIEHCAYSMAIQALEEIPRYRDLGTVDELAELQVQYYHLLHQVKEFEKIGTIEEFKALKENQRNCKDCAGCTNWKCDCANERDYAITQFANFLHEKAKENNGLRLSSKTRSWTHPCIFDYLEEFKNEQTSKEET